MDGDEYYGGEDGDTGVMKTGAVVMFVVCGV